MFNDNTIPPAAKEILREVTKIGLEGRYVPKFPIDPLDPDNRVQVRLDNVAPPENVNSYAAQMKAGAEFPPGIVTLDNHIVDCNTRVKAAKKLNLDEFPMIVIQASYDSASEDVKAKIRILGTLINQKGAQRLKSKETIAAIKDCLRLEYSIRRITEITGQSSTLVNKYARRRKASARFATLGMNIPLAENLEVYGSAEFEALNDEPFKNAALLSLDAGFTHREAKAFAAELKLAGADDKALEMIRRRRAEDEERIRNHAMTGSGKPSKTSQLRQILGQVTSLSRKVTAQDLVETNETQQIDHLARLNEAVDFLREVQKLQRAYLASVLAKNPSPKKPSDKK
jgi:hypothetical protein